MTFAFKAPFLTIALSFVVLQFGFVHSAQAQTPSGVVPVPSFAPKEAWNVQRTAIQGIKKLPNVTLPCMARTTYDNGYEVRLSGSQGQLLAMAIDFRQNIFARGRQYPSLIAVQGQANRPLTATAFSNSVLVFNMRDVAGMYQEMAAAPSFQLTIDGNVLRFGTAGLPMAINQLEACYHGRNIAPIAVAGTFSTQVPPVAQPAIGGVPPVPVAPAQQSDKLVNARFSSWDKVPTAVPPQPIQQPFKSQASMRSIWTAKAGDDLQQTLMRWGAKAGVDIAWQINSAVPVANDVRVSGTFEDAVQSLMAQNAAALGIEANMVGRPPQPVAQPISIVPTLHNSQVQAPPHVNASSEVSNVRWSATPGSNLQEVLSQWSDNAGVELIWQSNSGFKVKRAVQASGSYEAALQSLLGQYEGDSLRPAAQLNNDPVSGDRILFIQSTRVL